MEAPRRTSASSLQFAALLVARRSDCQSHQFRHLFCLLLFQFRQLIKPLSCHVAAAHGHGGVRSAPTSRESQGKQPSGHPAGERRRGSQGILLSICETEVEQVTCRTSEQQQTGNGNFRFQVGLKATKMCKRAPSSTYSSLPMSSTPPFKVLEMFLYGFVVSNLVRRHFCSWETRASTSQVTSLSLGGHTVKLSAAFGCRERTESISHHHHVAIWSRMFLGYNFVATLRNTATCSRCSTRRAIHEVSALLTSGKYSSYEVGTS